MAPALGLVLDGRSDLAKASEGLRSVRKGCWLLLVLKVSSRLLLLLQMLCGREGVFPQAVPDCHSLCKPIAACCQFHNMQQLIVFAFSQERG